VRAIFEAVPLSAARWVISEDEEALETFKRENRHRLYTDIAGNLAYLAQSQWAIDYAQEQNPKLRFVATMEI
jgi:peptide chain release factor 3